MPKQIFDGDDVKFLKLVLSCLFGALFALGSQAGAQREEPLADAVRTALSAAVSHQGPPELVHANALTEQTFTVWLAHTQNLLQQRLRPRGQPRAPSEEGQSPSLPSHELDADTLQREFLHTVWYESQRAGLDPAWVLGLIQVESGFRKFAISRAGARGYMQVMPFCTGETGSLQRQRTSAKRSVVTVLSFSSATPANCFIPRLMCALVV